MPHASRPYRTRFVFAAAFALLALLVCLLFLPADAPVAALSSAQAPPLTRNSHVPAVPDCESDWNVVPGPAAPDSTYTYGVDAISETDVWAVGYYYSTSGIYQTQTIHWNGTAWTIVPSPNVVSAENRLYAVAALSATDVWAVGYYFVYSAGQYRTLILHWDGDAWSVVPSPNIGGIHTFLNDVDAISSDDVWAVGYYGDAFNTPGTLTLHWDGDAWSVVPSPSVGSEYNSLTGVSAASRNDVWAVGWNFINSIKKTLILHWDGNSWSVVPSPNVGEGWNELLGVIALASNDVWAVGQHDGSYPWMGHSLTEHWDGDEWSVVPSPPEIGGLLSVDASSSNDMWAVGSGIEHWDGNSWSIAITPNPGTFRILYGVTAISDIDAWAVGNYYTGGGAAITLTEHYIPANPEPCVASPTPTVPPTPTTAPTSTTSPTPTATLVPPRCPGERFTDVCPGDPFYSYILALNDDGIVSGYNTAPPCPNSQWIPCFRPNAHSTRGQISQIVSLATGFNEPVSGQTFQDVPPGATFYTYTERLAQRGIISGYPCGSIQTEPCVPPENRPYFRTYNDVTRGQISKVVSVAFGWNEPVAGQQFEDVIPGSTFYEYIGRLYHRGIINGYPCGGPNEPCVPPANRPYFRPTNKATRGQISKIVQLARVQPAPTPTFAPTLLPTPSASPTCCSGITGSVTSSCQGSNYVFTETFNSTCAVERHGEGSLNFEISPNQSGPWTWVYRIDYLNRSIPPGTSHYSGTIYTLPLPPGYNWWRTRLYLIPADSGGPSCWVIDVRSNPQPACALPTTPTPTPTPTLAPFLITTPTPATPTLTATPLLTTTPLSTPDLTTTPTSTGTPATR
jgi:hypothetical protein